MSRFNSIIKKVKFFVIIGRTLLRGMTYCGKWLGTGEDKVLDTYRIQITLVKLNPVTYTIQITLMKLIKYR